MTVQVPDRFKVPNAFWVGLAKIGLTPATVLRQARVPATVYVGEKNLVTTAQFFALWRAAGELSSDPAAGLKLATQIDVGNRPPSSMAAYYAREALLSSERWERNQFAALEKLHNDVAAMRVTLERLETVAATRGSSAVRPRR